MQTRNDGMHVVLPAATSIDRRPDRTRLPVTMLRWPDGKVRHDGLSAANNQPNYPIAELIRLHRASELDAQKRNRGVEDLFVYYRVKKRETTIVKRSLEAQATRMAR